MDEGGFADTIAANQDGKAGVDGDGALFVDIATDVVVVAVDFEGSHGVLLLSFLRVALRRHRGGSLFIGGI